MSSRSDEKVQKVLKSGQNFKAIDLYISDATIITAIQTDANWTDDNSYTGSVIGIYPGQRYLDDNYIYEFDGTVLRRQDRYPSLEICRSIYLPVGKTTHEAIIGAYTAKLIDNLDLSVNRTIAEGYNRRVQINIKTLTTAGTIRVSGNVADDTAGTYTSTNEDIPVATTGYYQTTNRFTGLIAVSAQAGLVCTLDARCLDYFNLSGSPYELSGWRVEIKPNDADFDIGVYLLSVRQNGQLTLEDSVLITSLDANKRAGLNEKSNYKNYAVLKEFVNSDKEGFIVFIGLSTDQFSPAAGIEYVNVEILAKRL